ncbi:MAG: prephenate dehydrogenase [Flavobacteriaceae bacterium]|mgnify:FL=1|jgi:prephenate dehydrogenase|nr:prephenate dehydrogenase [Flavobacteriaceae bacterium]
MKIYVIGIGLIGGSMALELKQLFDDCTIIGVDQSETHLEEALSLGIIDEKGGLDTLAEADRVILSIPVKECLRLLPSILDQLNNDALLFDVGSTKEQLCKVIENHPKRDQYLAAHPIAGTEFSGPKAAHLGLFKGKPQILCEAKKTRADLLTWSKTTFRQMGMYLRFMGPQEHDRHMACVSHLSHVSSFMLGKTVLEQEANEQNIFDLAGSGFESTVRLAKSSPDMWAPIFEQNKENVLEILSAYIKNLEAFKSKLAADAIDDLHQQMKHTNQLTTILNGIKHNN